MKILLLGEYSALHKNLKEGLQEFGHEVMIAGGGDGFKKVPVDLPLESTRGGLLQKLENRILPLQALKQLKNFDVVQIIKVCYLRKIYFCYVFCKYLLANSAINFLLAK